MIPRISRNWWLFFAVPLLVFILVFLLIAPFPDENLQAETQVFYPIVLLMYGDTAILLIILGGTLSLLGVGGIFSRFFAQRTHSIWLKCVLWLLPILAVGLLCNITLLRGNLKEIQVFQGSAAVYRLVDIAVPYSFGDEEFFEASTLKLSALYECPYGSILCRFKHLTQNSLGRDDLLYPHLEQEPVTGNLYLFRGDEPVFTIKNVVPPVRPQIATSVIQPSNVQSIREITHLISNRPRSIHWLPDGKSFFVEQYPRSKGGIGFDLWLYSVAALESPRHVEFPETPALSWWVGAFSTDRSMVAMIGYDAIDLRETRSGKRLAQLKRTDRWAMVAFSPNGEFLIEINSSNSAINVYDLKTMPDLKPVKSATDASFENALVVFSPDGMRLAVMGNGLWIWDFPAFTGRRLDGGNYSTYSNTITFSPDGANLAAGTDGALNLWDVRTGRKLQRIEGGLAVYGWIVAFSPDSKLMAFAPQFDDTIKIWDMNTAKVIRELGGHDYDIMSLSFNSDGTMVASTSKDGTVRLWGIQPTQ